MPETDVTKMKVADLKRELKLRGLPSTGNKTELQDRLQSALLEGELSLDDTAISGEDLLDEDAVLTDEEDNKILAADENELLSPTEELNAAAEVDKADNTNTSAAAPSGGAKKIVLKRKTSITTAAIANITGNGTATVNSTSKDSDAPAPAKVVKTSTHTPITIGDEKKDEPEKVTMPSKISQLTPEQRLEMRAKKFGITSTAASTPTNATSATKPTIDGTKVAAATTVASGTGTATAVAASSTAASATDNNQIEILKKRAERFGCVVSSKIAKLDAQEKLLKRKERFGGSGGSVSASASANASGNGNASKTDAKSLDMAEKARLRLERFKTTPTAEAAKN